MKIYKVKFMEYTNALEDHVRNPETGKYLTVGKDTLITEHDIEKFMKYGGGFRKLEYVGDLILLNNQEGNKSE